MRGADGRGVFFPTRPYRMMVARNRSQLAGYDCHPAPREVGVPEGCRWGACLYRGEYAKWAGYRAPAPARAPLPLTSPHIAQVPKEKTAFKRPKARASPSLAQSAGGVP